MKILAQKVWRIGVQTLFEKDGKLYISIKNRTYNSIVELPWEKINIWIKEFSR
jgi:hypothetical protein